VGSVFDVTGGVTACPVTAALPAIWSIDPQIGGLYRCVDMP